jgi:hypothetical protein
MRPSLKRINHWPTRLSFEQLSPLAHFHWPTRLFFEQFQLLAHAAAHIECHDFYSTSCIATDIFDSASKAQLRLANDQIASPVSD